MADINIDVYTGFLFARDERSPAAEGTFRADVNHEEGTGIEVQSRSVQLQRHLWNL